MRIGAVIATLWPAPHPCSASELFHDLNGGQNCHGVYKLKDEETGKWSNIRVWWVPEFHEEEVELPIEESSDESDIPF